MKIVDRKIQRQIFQQHLVKRGQKTRMMNYSTVLTL